MTTLDGYTSLEFTDAAITREVFVRGAGPAVIVMHEVPGIHPLVLRFAERVAAAGHRVYLPSLLGDPGRAVTPGSAAGQILKALCIRREFSAWATNQSSPIVEWLRALARKAHADCGGPGVGAIGMCLTGNFAMAMMTEPSVIAPVLSQPSLPVAMGAKRRADIGMSQQEIAIVRERLDSENLSAIGMRFHGDPMVPPERFASYKRCFGDRFEAIEIDAADALPNPGAKPHAVLTINLRDDDAQGATKLAETRVIDSEVEAEPHRERARRNQPVQVQLAGRYQRCAGLRGIGRGFVEQIAQIDRQLRVIAAGLAAEDDARVEGAVAVDFQIQQARLQALADRGGYVVIGQRNALRRLVDDRVLVARA